MNDQDRDNLFSELITSYHTQLYAYIFSIVKNREDTEDLFQSVCLILWRKFELFQPGTSFFSWARQTAKLTVCNFLRHQGKLTTCATEGLLDSLAETVSDFPGNAVELHVDALQRCKEKLSAADVELLDLRYVEDLSVREIAKQLQRLEPSVCRSLNRVRRWLLECIRADVRREDHSVEEPS